MSNYRRAPNGYQSEGSRRPPPADYSLHSIPERPLQGDARSQRGFDPRAGGGAPNSAYNYAQYQEQPSRHGSQAGTVTGGSRGPPPGNQNQRAPPQSDHSSHLDNYIRQADAAIYNGAGSRVNNFARSVHPDDSASNYGGPKGQQPGYYPQGMEFTRSVTKKKSRL
jgi:hypothetical protein